MNRLILNIEGHMITYTNYVKVSETNSKLIIIDNHTKQQVEIDKAYIALRIGDNDESRR